MANIPIGTIGESKTRVTGDIAISFMGLDNARVLSTPEMIRLMERTCRDTVLPMLDSGYDTVGTHVDVYHLAAAPLGSTVLIKVKVTEVEKRRIKFQVEARTEQEKVGEGMHERAIINVAKFAAAQAQKTR